MKFTFVEAHYLDVLARRLISCSAEMNDTSQRIFVTLWKKRGFKLVLTNHRLLQMLHSDWLLSGCLFRDRPRFAKKQRKTIWLLQKTRVLLRLKNFLDINNSGHRVYTKTIRQLGLVVYDRIFNSDFVLVYYSLIDNSASLSNC